MKARTLTAAAFVAAALVTSVGSGQSKGIRPLVLRPAPVTSPLLGISFSRLDTRLVRLDPRSLLPRGRSISLERYTGAWSFSPDRRQLVFGSGYSQLSESPAAVRFFDVSTLRPLHDLVLGPSAEIQVLDWAAPDRLLAVVRSCCPAASSVSLVDTASGAVLARHALAGELVAAGRARAALVLLLEPTSFGPVRLAVAGADGALRTVDLDRVLGGPSTTPPPQPRAQAKTGALERSARSALWLGDGRLAVFGSDGTARWQDGRLEVRTRPSGLTVIDTSTWQSQVLDPGSAWAVVARDALLSFGATWDSAKQRETGSGLRVYGRDGAERLHLFGSRAIAIVEVFGSRAFVHRSSPDSDYSIVSLTSGRVLRTIHRDLPLVLRGAGSGY